MSLSASWVERPRRIWNSTLPTPFWRRSGRHRSAAPDMDDPALSVYLLLCRRRQSSLQRYSSADRLRIDGNLLQLRLDVGRNVLLVAPAEILRKERLHRRNHCQIVDGPGETVAFVGCNKVLDRLPVIAYRCDNLVALADVYARIILALHYHQRRHN